MKVLVVENDIVVVDTIKMCIAIRWSGSTVLVDQNGDKAALLVESEKPDIVLMELDLPAADGLEVIQEIRKFSSVPIIVISNRHDDPDKVTALEFGADDYILKPPSHTELLARMRAVMRRVGGRTSQNGQVVIGGPGLTIDLEGRWVKRNGQEVSLTPIEWNFLSYMAQNAPRIIPHRLLAKKVWDSESSPNHEAIKMVVHRVRAKLGDNPKHPTFIHSHRGQGYSLTLSES